MRKIILVLIIIATVPFLTACHNGEIAGVQDTEKNEISVTFLDIGQGDAIFIETKEGRQILIDGGPDEKVLEKLKYEMSWGDKFIDVVVLTHPHADHLTGLNSILKRYEVGEIWLTGVVHTSATYFEFLDLIKEEEIKTRVIYNCAELRIKKQEARDTDIKYSISNIGDEENREQRECTDKIAIEDGIYFDVLWPTENLTGRKIDNLNNSSIVLRLATPEKSFLLTGDAEVPVEEKILSFYQLSNEVEENNSNYNNILKTDVLKLGHHGASDASSEEWLEAISPTQVVITVGRDNNYGHPSLRVIRRLEKMGIEARRTDEEGEVRF